MQHFAVYLHPETTELSKPEEQIESFGQSWAYFRQVREELVSRLPAYPTIPVRKADYHEFQRVHTAHYVEQLQSMAANIPLEQPPKLSLECIGMEYCLPGYCYSLGGMYAAIDLMRVGALERAYCFSFGGHHAYANWGHGYCILHPLAVAVRYAQEQGFRNVLIIDWDHHHGDATQSIFANDSTVYCISIHSAIDLYMAKMAGIPIGTTSAAEAVGHCNIPLLNSTFSDDIWQKLDLHGQYYRADQFYPVFQETLANLPWSPDLICIFSGYDSHRDDCGDQISNWTNDDFRRLTSMMCTLAKQNSAPILSVHGGGYKLPVTIAAAMAHLEVLAAE